MHVTSADKICMLCRGRNSRSFHLSPKKSRISHCHLPWQTFILWGHKHRKVGTNETSRWPLCSPSEVKILPLRHKGIAVGWCSFKSSTWPSARRKISFYLCWAVTALNYIQVSQLSTHSWLQSMVPSALLDRVNIFIISAHGNPESLVLLLWV